MYRPREEINTINGNRESTGRESTIDKAVPPVRATALRSRRRARERRDGEIAYSYTVTAYAQVRVSEKIDSNLSKY